MFKKKTRFSLRDKRLFEIIENEIAEVDYICIIRTDTRDVPQECSYKQAVACPYYVFTIHCFSHENMMFNLILYLLIQI